MIPMPRALLSSLIDYAGLFPPAGLDMAATVANYAAYQRRPDGWALARLVVPVARLAEFSGALAALPTEARDGTRWPLTALVGSDTGADAAAVQAFNRRGAPDGPVVLALEARVASVAQVEAVTASFRSGPELYCELPLSADLPALASAVRRSGARAKIRTGGITPADIPAPEAVLAFLAVCRAERLAFKATAGLHHPVRGPAPLTYEPGSARATMFGYLNLVLAAAVLWEGRPESEALTLLGAEGPGALHLDAAGAVWGQVRIGAEAVARARREFLLAIGSCSFTEPLEEIRALGVELAEAERGVPVTGSR